MIIGVINQLSYPGGRTLSVVVANRKPGLLGDSHIYIILYIYMMIWMIWMIWKGSSPTKSMCIGEQSLELLLDTSHVCFSSAGLCFGLCFCASGFWACFCWYFPSFMIRSFPRLGTSCLHLTRSQESEKEIERERKREKERRPQPPFGPSVDSLCHP